MNGRLMLQGSDYQLNLLSNTIVEICFDHLLNKGNITIMEET